MNDRELIAFLWRTGHFFNPAHPETLNVAEADLPALTLADTVVKLAVKSFQESDASLVTLTRVMHARDPVTDGDAGPATRALAVAPRCPVPDHPPPPGVRVRHADPDLDGVLRSMQAWAEAGSGSWPVPGCDPTRTGVHSIRVGINTSAAPAKVKAYLAEALALASACYAEMGLAVRYVLDGPDKVEIAKRFESLSGSVIGWNEFPRPGTCNQTINGRLDTGFTPDVRLWANLEAHETGHGVGLQHTRGGIMNPSILNVWPLSWKGTPSEATMRRYFGGEPLPGSPIDPTDPPPIDPPPPPPSAGSITIDLARRAVTLPAGWRAVP